MSFAVQNEDRGGRNAVYWAVRKQYGEEAAKPFYVPKSNNSFKSNSSSGSFFSICEMGDEWSANQSSSSGGLPW